VWLRISVRAAHATGWEHASKHVDDEHHGQAGWVIFCTDRQHSDGVDNNKKSLFVLEQNGHANAHEPAPLHDMQQE
jgi:hypothetical protein